MINLPVCAACVVLLGFCLPAYASSLAQIETNGSWQVWRGSRDGNAACGITSADQQIYVALDARGNPSTVDVLVGGSGMAVGPGRSPRATFAFPGSRDVSLIGRPAGTALAFSMTGADLPAWLHGFTAGQSMTVAVDGASPPAVTFDLRGTTRSVTTLLDCIAKEGIAGLPAPLDIGSTSASSAMPTAGSPSGGGDGALMHVTLALAALDQAEHALSQLRSDSQQTYGAMGSFRSMARSVLGCASTSDDDCLSNTSGVVVRSNNRALLVQWNTLFLIAGFKTFPPFYIIERLNVSITKVRKFQISIKNRDQIPAEQYLNDARSASEDVALLVSVNKGVFYSIANDVRDSMARVQIDYRGMMLNITDPGQRVAKGFVRIVALFEKASEEIDVATATISLPPGRVLIAAPDK